MGGEIIKERTIKIGEKDIIETQDSNFCLDNL